MKQSQATFAGVLKDVNFCELYVGNYHPESLDYLFVSVQTLNSQALDQRLPADYYDYIVIDESHHAAAHSYGRALEYFQPKVLLGLTSGGAPQIFDLSRRHPRQSRGQLCQRQSCLHAGAHGRPGHLQVFRPAHRGGDPPAGGHQPQAAVSVPVFRRVRYRGSERPALGAGRL